MTDAFNSVTDNPILHRYELVENGSTAFATYRRGDGVVIIPHVEAPTELQGTGAAGRLMEGVVEHIRAEHLKMVPACPYAAAWLKRHPEHADVLA
jgi:predicted GNAT family acetyltransferase